MHTYKKKFQNKNLILSFFSHPLVKSFFKRILFVKKNVNPSYFFVRCFIYVFFIVFSLSFFSHESNFTVTPYGSNGNANMFSFLLSTVNLIFHEAGHVIFIPFGKFITILGGSLLQCLIPLIVMIHFLRQKDHFDASIGFLWFGQNFIDVSAYIYDAWDRKLILLGGVTGRESDSHDWYNLLTMVNRLHNYDEISSFSYNLGKLIMFLAFVWGAVILYKTFLILKVHGFKKQWDPEDDMEILKLKKNQKNWF